MKLRGWRCNTTTARRRGTIVYLHGVADNRGSAVGVIETFRPQGFDVIAYDGRAHGDSGGERCTYGYYEKRDLPAFARAEHDGRFVVDEVSPVKAAADITVPVLLIHGARDRDTLPMHSHRVFAALHEPKRLIEVEGAAHNDVLNSATLVQIKDWLNPLVKK